MNELPNNQNPEFRISLSMLICTFIFTSLTSLAVSTLTSQLDIVDCSDPNNFSEYIKQEYGVGQEAVDYCRSQLEGTRSMGSWVSLGLLVVPIITGIGYWRTNKGKRQ